MLKNNAITTQKSVRKGIDFIKVFIYWFLAKKHHPKLFPKAYKHKLTHPLTKLYKFLTKKVAHYWSSGYNLIAFKARECSLLEQSVIKNRNKTKNYLTG
ncbi:hypothetical protein [Gilliamella sp. Pas-s95]|uniref:hypothetical protein n=1 Tax=Gilliamella sp. Pas-s95 TaxID=2687317 RepID=UPI00132B1C58|nr:hypothetical protein [Gilliamella sp. Pas-s95]MWN06044.1 hypothetical protein [Gilliamella sp. Pas-s95]